MAKVITSSSAWMILVSCGAALSVCLKVRAENSFAAMWPDSTKKSWTLCKIQIKVQQLVFLSPCSKNASELLFDAQSWYCHLLQVKGTVHLIMKIQSLSKGCKKNAFQINKGTLIHWAKLPTLPIFLGDYSLSLPCPGFLSGWQICCISPECFKAFSLLVTATCFWHKVCCSVAPRPAACTDSLKQRARK